MVLTWAEPPEAALCAQMDHWSQAFAAALRQPGVTGIVLALSGGHHQLPGHAAALSALCAQVEAAPVPVAAVLTGKVGGAVWALALAAHYRIGAPTMLAVMAEARFGLMPGAGVTQRLPRLVGAAETFRLLLGTRPEPAADLLRLGALDLVQEGDLIAAAARLCAPPRQPRRTRDLRKGFAAPRDYVSSVQAYLDQTAGEALAAPRAIVRAVEGALILPFAEGLALEAVLLEDLAEAPQTGALRHALAAEHEARAGLRQAGASVRGQTLGALNRLGLWQAGADRAEFAVRALQAGLQLTLCAEGPPDPALVERINAIHETEVARGTMTAEVRDAGRARLVLAAGAAALAGLDLVLDCAGSLEAPAVPVASFGAAAGAGQGRAALHSPKGAGEHAEISVPAGAEVLPALHRLLDLARRMGWRAQITGAGGFIEPALRRAQRQAAARLVAMGIKGADLTAGMAHAGIGAVVSGARRPLSAAGAEVAQLALAAIANEGARLIGAGIAGSALEVDAAAMSAGIMPRWTGGPMYQADQRGLILLRSDLRKLGPEPEFEPAPDLERRIAEGSRFVP